MTKPKIFSAALATALICFASVASAQVLGGPGSVTVVPSPGTTVAPQVIVPGTGFDAYAGRSAGGGFLGGPAGIGGGIWPFNGAANCGEQPPWIHRSGIFGELLYLTARDTDLIIATGGAGGGIERLETDYDFGFRVGATWAYDTVGSIRVTYSRWESDAAGSFALGDRPILAPVPFPVNTFDRVDANLSVDFDTLDVDWRLLAGHGDHHAVNAFFGVRLANLNQSVSAFYDNTDPGLPADLTRATELKLEGIGPRFGMDAEKHACATGFFVYGSFAASFLIADIELSQLATKDERVVPVFDVEAGVGWQSPAGRFRIQAGYLASAWFNTPTLNEALNVAFSDPLGDTDGPVTFDGLTARLTFQW